MRQVPVLCALVGVALVACGSNPPATLEFVEVTPANPRIGDIATVRFRAPVEAGQIIKAPIIGIEGHDLIAA